MTPAQRAALDRAVALDEFAADADKRGWADLRDLYADLARRCREFAKGGAQ
jgi:hypothetical protein